MVKLKHLTMRPKEPARSGVENQSNKRRAGRPRAEQVGQRKIVRNQFYLAGFIYSSDL